MTNEERVRKVVILQLGVKEVDVKLSSHFQEDLGADELDVVELVLALEEEFGLETIPPAEAEKITTVMAALIYVNEHVPA